MADFKISELTTAGTLTGTELVPVAQSGTTVRATVDQIRQEGTNIIARNTTSARTEFGAVGPSGQPGTKWGTSGDAVLYRDGTAISLNISGIQKLKVNSPNTTSLTLGVSSLDNLLGAGVNTTAFGINALQTVTVGTNNTAIGENTLKLNTGNNSTAVGFGSLATAVSGGNNTAIGSGASALLDTGGDVTSIGKDAAGQNTAVQTTVIGYRSVYTGTGPNTVIGTLAMANPSSATANVAIGHGVANNSGTNSQCVAIGATANNSNNSGNGLVAIGAYAFRNSTTAGDTVAVGYRSGEVAINGAIENVYLGTCATIASVSGLGNVYAGHNAGSGPAAAFATAADNSQVAIGFESGPSGLAGTTKSNAVAVGYRAAGLSNSVALGANTSANATGSAAIGTDNSGAGATTATANEIKLGTALHTTNVYGRTRVSVGAGAKGVAPPYATVGGTIATNFADAGNVGAGETDLYSYNILGNTFVLNNEQVTARWCGTLAANANNKRLRVYFAGNLILDSTATTNAGLLSHWLVDVELFRESATVVRAMARLHQLNAPSAALRFIQTYTAVGGLDLTVTNILKITGTATANNDIIAQVGRVSWNPRAT